MTPADLLQIVQGPHHFLRSDPEEVRRILPDLDKTLPKPPRIFLDDEEATPLCGFPILLSDGLTHLRRALERYVISEEEVQTAIQTRRTYDRKAHAAAWERYRSILSRAVENVTMSSYGRHYPAVFWLHHSLELARLLKETPKRILRVDSETGRQFGDLIKYRVLERWLDRVVDTTYDLVSRLAVDTDEAEEELFPRLLTRMRDNVLILTEDHISHNLAELGSYFAGYLHIDGRDLRRRLEALEQWHAESLERDDSLRDAVRHLLDADPHDDSRRHLIRSGYVSFLATRGGYDERRLFALEHRKMWESLLLKLKEFELFHGVRRLLRPVETDGDRLVTRETGRTLYLSTATRPMDFLAPWVVDPLVDRFGLIYDITDFSEIVSVLRRSGSEAQDDSFRKMFRFQRRVNRLAAAHRMTMEKYLGDGAFYSSRHAADLLAAAIQIQRFYRQELEAGFPFDRGLRIALNYGQYRLIPIGRKGGSSASERYEFFGHGLVELSRLTTGKASKEIDEIKTLLLTYGYPESTVYKFFAPLLREDVDLVDRMEEERPFRAYINRNGNLINEGIVTTEPFLDRLDRESPWDRLYLGRSGERIYVGVPLPNAPEELLVGVRHLGKAHLKGLDPLPVYELVDGDALTGLEEMLDVSLAHAMKKLPPPGSSGSSEPLSEPLPKAEPLA